MIPYILTEKSLTAVINGKAHSMNSDHPAWEQAKDALGNEEWERLEKLFDVQQAVEDYLDEDAEIEIRDGQVLYQGESVHNLVVEKIMSFMRNGLPYKPLVKFLGKLMDKMRGGGRPYAPMQEGKIQEGVDPNDVMTMMMALKKLMTSPYTGPLFAAVIAGMPVMAAYEKHVLGKMNKGQPPVDGGEM